MSGKGDNNMTNKEVERKLAWYKRMIDLAFVMSDKELAELNQWERENITEEKRLGTSDWPGWERYAELK